MQKAIPQLSRAELISALVRAVYESSTAAVFFHSAVAEQFQLGVTEEKTLLILSEGPRTAGEIAHHTGLTTPSVTSLIDRLESKGFVQRVRDPHDRRRVIVQANEARLAELLQVLNSMQGIFEGLLDGYSNEQLAAIVDFLTRTTQRSREAVAKMSRGDS